MPVRVNYRSVITVDDSGMVTRTPTPPRRVSVPPPPRPVAVPTRLNPQRVIPIDDEGRSVYVPNYAARGNAVAVTTSLINAALPQSNNGGARSKYQMTAFESETYRTFRDVGTDDKHLFADQRSIWEDNSANPSCEEFPGWHAVILQSFLWQTQACYNPRTLATRAFYPNQLQQWWANLEPTEQEIEVALSISNAAFDHDTEKTWDFVRSWVERNETLINTVSRRFSVDPALVAGIISSEMLYDYGWSDRIQDAVGFTKVDTPLHIISTNALGYAQVHRETLQLAYAHLEEQYGAGILNPWISYEQDPITIDNMNSMSIGLNALTDRGTVIQAAAVTRLLVDAYTSSSEHDRDNLSDADMAVIWGAYRAGIRGVNLAAESELYGFEDIEAFQNQTIEGLGDQAILAQPVMAYMIQVIFGGGR